MITEYRTAYINGSNKNVNHFDTKHEAIDFLSEKAAGILVDKLVSGGSRTSRIAAVPDLIRQYEEFMEKIPSMITELKG